MKKWEKLLKEKGYTPRDVDAAFREKIEELRKKRTTMEQDYLEGVRKSRVGNFVTLQQSDYRIKMFVLQELYDSKGKPSYVRFGYYKVSLKKLETEGKLSIVWGRFNPTIPKKDFEKLVRMAEEKEIL
jgi:hypothetical protein